MTNFNMPVDCSKTPFELYCECMKYFKNALLLNPTEDSKIYTAKLSQIFQDLLDDPYSQGLIGSSVSCIKLTGVLCGRMLEVEKGAGRESTQGSWTSTSIAQVSKDRFEMEDEMVERMRNIFAAVGKLTENNLSGRAIRDLVHIPKDNLIWGCVPHSFRAIKQSQSCKLELKLPNAYSSCRKGPNR